MKQELTKSFTLIIGGFLLLVLNLIPDHDLGGFMAAAAGFNLMSVLVVIIGALLVVAGALKLANPKKLNVGAELRKYALIVLGAAILYVASLFFNGNTQLIVQVLSAIALWVGYMLAKKSTDFSFNNEATKGTLWILMGGIMLIYKEIGGGIGFKIIALVGLIFFFMGLSKLTRNLDENGAQGTKKNRLALILILIATFVDMIPLMGILAGLLAIIAFIVELTGYLRLKKSDSIQEIGQKGAGLLVLNMVLLAIASFFDIIPLVGNSIVGFFALTGVVLWSIGWLRIEMGTVK